MGGTHDDIVEAVRGAQGRCVAFTGAGISAASGIPTFRDQEGTWQRYSPTRYGTSSGLLSSFVFHFDELHQFFVASARTFLEAEPNTGHTALADLEKHGLLGATITQNVDGLHQRAGTGEIIELHGSFFSGRCRSCGDTRPVEPGEIRSLIDDLESDGRSRVGFLRTYRARGPRCRRCASIVRPDMVLFGESVSSASYKRAADLVADCGVLLVVGTSLAVRPASDLPYIAADAGATIVEINAEPTPFSPLADITARAPAQRVLPAVARACAEPPRCQ